jgi:hypothetical protein
MDLVVDVHVAVVTDDLGRSMQLSTTPTSSVIPVLPTTSSAVVGSLSTSNLLVGPCTVTLGSENVAGDEVVVEVGRRCSAGRS